MYHRFLSIIIQHVTAVRIHVCIKTSNKQQHHCLKDTDMHDHFFCCYSPVDVNETAIFLPFFFLQRILWHLKKPKKTSLSSRGICIVTQSALLQWPTFLLEHHLHSLLYILHHKGRLCEAWVKMEVAVAVEDLLLGDGLCRV